MWRMTGGREKWRNGERRGKKIKGMKGKIRRREGNWTDQVKVEWKRKEMKWSKVEGLWRDRRGGKRRGK